MTNEEKYCPSHAPSPGRDPGHAFRSRRSNIKQDSADESPGRSPRRDRSREPRTAMRAGVSRRRIPLCPSAYGPLAAAAQACRSMPDMWQNASERIRHPASRGGALMPNRWGIGIRRENIWSAVIFAPVGSSATLAKHKARSETTGTLSRSATVRSAGLSSRAPSTVDASITSDANMAWLLAIAADVCLTGHERTMTFVELGCGENHLAIERILNAVLSSRMALPVAIFDRLTRWLEGYVGSTEEPRLRTMLGEIRAQQFQPVPLHTQSAQCGDVGRTADAAPPSRVPAVLGPVGASGPTAGLRYQSRPGRSRSRAGEKTREHS